MTESELLQKAAEIMEEREDEICMHEALCLTLTPPKPAHSKHYNVFESAFWKLVKTFRTSIPYPTTWKDWEAYVSKTDKISMIRNACEITSTPTVKDLEA